MKVISGCQVGVDEAGLRAAYDLGIATGGTMPNGWNTQTGPRPDWGIKYGLVEHVSPKYPPRTRKNVIDSDVTVLFGNMNSSGSKLTIKYCKENDKPYYVVEFHGYPLDIHDNAIGIVFFLLHKQPNVINIAGNRENSNKGVSEFTYAVLSEALDDFKRSNKHPMSSLFEH